MAPTLRVQFATVLFALCGTLAVSIAKKKGKGQQPSGTPGLFRPPPDVTEDPPGIGGQQETTYSPTNSSARLQLNVCDTWTYDIADSFPTEYTTDVVMIDMEDTSAAYISQLKLNGITVSCYISGGSWEEWRSDAGLFTEAIKGNDNGWPGERWLDVRSNLTKDLITRRIERAAAKGCDLLEVDNVDGYYDQYWDMTGFGLTKADSKDYLSFLAQTAHENGLFIGLKNCAELATDMQPEFDFSIVESCFKWDECPMYSTFVDNSKPVFAVEYETSHDDSICNYFASLGFSLIYSNYDVTYNNFCLQCTYTNLTG